MVIKMKAIILAAGKGRRLMPLTEKIPKCLVQIGGETILEKTIRNCTNAGIKDFVIVIGHGKEFVLQELSSLKYKNLNLTMVENLDYANTNTGVSLNLGLGQIDDEPIIIDGDLIFDKRILDILIKQKETSMVIDNEKILTEESFKVEIENDKIKSMGKEIPIKESDGEFIGLSIVKTKDLDIFKRIVRKNSEDRNQYYSCAFKRFSKIGYIKFVFVDGLKWTEVDTTDDVTYAETIVGYIK